MSKLDATGVAPPGLRETLRDGSWATPQRLRAYGWLAIGVYAASVLGMLVTARGLIAPDGQPLGTDFVSFWTAARLALGGDAALPYGVAAFAEAQRALFGPIPFYAFFYPPSFLLLLAPFGLLPYGAALVLFLALSFAVLASAAVRITEDRAGVVALLASPAFFITIGHGQNAFLFAGLLGWALLLIDRRPITAGLLIAALTIKPQLGLLLPLALLAGGRWRCLIAAGLGSLGLAGFAGIAFGPEIWHRFLEQVPFAGDTMRSGIVPWGKMVTVYAACRVIGLGEVPALVAQGLSTLTMACIVVVVWRDRHPDRAALRGALLVTAIPLAAPVALDYDLTVMILPLLWLAVTGRRHGFRPWEISVAALVCLLPFLARPLATHLMLPLAPAILTILLALLLRRWRAAGGRVSPTLTAL